jgi:hypothetical protein
MMKLRTDLLQHLTAEDILEEPGRTSTATKPSQVSRKLELGICHPDP